MYNIIKYSQNCKEETASWGTAKDELQADAIRRVSIGKGFSRSYII